MPPRAIRAQTIRAILFANATRTSIGGLRNSRLPGARPRRGMDVALDDNAVGTNDQQASQGSFAHSGRCSETLLAPGRMLPGHQTKPGGKVACLAEGLGWGSQNSNGRSNQRPDARHRHQPPGDVIFLGATGDLRIELPDLCLQVRERRDQSLQRGNGIGRQVTFRVFHDRDQACGVGCPLARTI